MGLTLAESELTKLDVERDKDRLTLEKERACAEQIPPAHHLSQH